MCANAAGSTLPVDSHARGADLRILERDWQCLESHLLGDGFEHAAVLVCGVRRDEATITYLVREVRPLTETDYLDFGRDHLAVAPAALARYAKHARLTGGAIVLAHSHPFPGPVGASSIDLRTEIDLCGRVLTRRTGLPAAGLIIGPEGADARSWTSAGATPLHTIRVLGDRTRRIPVTSRGLAGMADAAITNAGSTLEGNMEAANLPRRSPDERSYSNENRVQHDLAEATNRQELLWGAVGQETLRRSHAVVVGCGGTGSHVAVQLAHLRIGALTLIDDDDVEVSNLSRIIGATPGDVGRPKVDVLAELCQRIHPNISVTTVPDSILDVDPRQYSGVDVIVCATDSHGSRSLLTEVAAQYLLPMVDLGVEVVPDAERFRAGGGVRVLRPGQGCLWCADTLSPALVREEYLDPQQRASEMHRGYLRSIVEPAPSVVALNGVVASLAVLEACQLLVGMLGGRRDRLLFRAEQRALNTVGIQRNPSCHVCGDHGLLALGDARRVNTRWPGNSLQEASDLS